MGFHSFPPAAPGANPGTFVIGSGGGTDKRSTGLGVQSLHAFRPVGPSDFAEWFAIDELAVLTIQAIEVAVAMSLDQGFHLFAVHFRVHQYRSIDSVVIPNIVRAVLKMPFVTTVVWIERNNATREEIIARADFAIEVRRGIADSPIESIQLRVIRASDPRRATSSQPRFAFPGFECYLRPAEVSSALGTV